MWMTRSFYLSQVVLPLTFSKYSHENSLAACYSLKKELMPFAITVVDDRCSIGFLMLVVGLVPSN